MSLIVPDWAFGPLLIIINCMMMQVDANGSTTSAHAFVGPRYRIDALLGWPLLLTCNSSSITKPSWFWLQHEPVKMQLRLRSNETTFYEFNGSQLLIPIVRQRFEDKVSYLCVEENTMTGVAFYLSVKDCDPNPCHYGKCSKFNVESGNPRIQCLCDKDYDGDFCELNNPKSGWLFLVWTLQVVVIGLFFGLSLCILQKRRKDEMVRKRKENDIRTEMMSMRKSMHTASPLRRREVATTGASLLEASTSVTSAVAAGKTALPQSKKALSKSKSKQVATVGVLANKKKTLFEIPAKSKRSTQQGLRTRAAGTAA